MFQIITIQYKGLMIEDVTNFDKLCLACRTGDIDSVDSLISIGININDVDRFDNSAFFPVCLCGHEEVVKLLLQSGAVCDTLLKKIRERCLPDISSCTNLNIKYNVFLLIIKFLYLIPVLHKISPLDYLSLDGLSEELNTDILSNFFDKSNSISDPSDKSELMTKFQFKYTEIARHCEFVEIHIFENIMEVNDPQLLKPEILEDLRKAFCSADLAVLVENPEGLYQVYLCHLAILSCTQYFKMLFSFPFSEGINYNNSKKLSLKLIW